MSTATNTATATATATTANILAHNSWVFANAMADISRSQEAHQATENTNCFNRIAGHVAVTRHGIAAMLGIDVPDHGWGAFAAGGPSAQWQSEHACPPLSEIAATFDAVSKALLAGLPQVTDDVLEAKAPFGIPGEAQTVRAAVEFLTMHEAYHIGQLGLLKKSMGGKRVMDG